MRAVSTTSITNFQWTGKWNFLTKDTLLRMTASRSNDFRCVRRTRPQFRMASSTLTRVKLSVKHSIPSVQPFTPKFNVFLWRPCYPHVDGVRYGQGRYQ